MNDFQDTEFSNILQLSDLFRDMKPAALETLEKKLELVTCTSGDYLIREGEDSDYVYIILSGRLQIFYHHPTKGKRILSELTRGQTVGEIAIITGGKRTASVRAIRDSLLAGLSKEAFDHLLQRFPGNMMKHFAGAIITRLQNQTTGKFVDQEKILNIAIVPTNPNVPSKQLAHQLALALSQIGTTLHLNNEKVDQLLGKKNISQTPVNSPDNIRLAHWLNHLESEYRFIIYEADNTQTEWSKRCIHQADKILLAGNADDSPLPGEMETGILDEPAYRHLSKNLAILHDKSIAGYQQTKNWLQCRKVNNHYHVLLSENRDIQRLARLISGNGIGLVVSGGGARGFAHIGGIKALREAGIPIDKIGGTSMGSIVAAMHALDWDYSRMLEQAMSFNYKMDYTFPAVSLTAGNNLTHGLSERLGDKQIEDMHINFFCVSTDLSSSSPKIHHSGPLWKYVRASASVPGLFPPVIDQGCFLVDGAIANNMPVDIMSKFDDIGQVIAFDVSGSHDLEADYEIDGSLSGWRVMLSWINPFTRSITLPRLSKTLIHSSLAKSVESTEKTKRLADLYIQFPVQQFGLTDFGNIRKIVETGYESTKAKITDWNKTQAFKET